MQAPIRPLVFCLVLVGCASGPQNPKEELPKTPQQTVATQPAPKEKQADTREEKSDFDDVRPSTHSSVQHGFSMLPGWKEADQTAALTAFLRSCSIFSKNWNAAAKWKQACEVAGGVEHNKDAARMFFEQSFIPQKLALPGGGKGLLTAYYEPELSVRRVQDPGFDEPIFARPPGLITVDLKRFDADGASSRKVMGRVKDGLLVPYFSRAEIKKRDGTVLAWGAAADVFFLQIQGSGRLRFEDGHTMRAAFAGHNGHPYTSIGRILLNEGELEPGKASKGAIEKWMQDAGPEKANILMSRNKRYVFFEIKPVNDPELGPTGTQGAALTAGASLAVDPDLYPFGTPIWVETRLPRDETDWKGEKTQFLAIAQDTGGAINGPMRGDLFIGSGLKAGRRAGIVKHGAHWWALIPRAAVERPGEPKS